MASSDPFTSANEKKVKINTHKNNLISLEEIERKWNKN